MFAYLPRIAFCFHSNLFLTEAGIDIRLLGVLQIQHSIGGYNARARAIYFAIPKDLNAAPKSVPDKESEGAEWKSLDELERLSNISPPEGLRGTELLDWAKYLERGGSIFPMSVSAKENSFVPGPLNDLEKELLVNGLKGVIKLFG